jgi:hypothetical protein
MLLSKNNAIKASFKWSGIAHKASAFKAIPSIPVVTGSFDNKASSWLS